MYTQELNDDESDRFDMFELARSWTPGFCASSSFEDGAYEVFTKNIKTEDTDMVIDYITNSKEET